MKDGAHPAVRVLQSQGESPGSSHSNEAVRIMREREWGVVPSVDVVASRLRAGIGAGPAAVPGGAIGLERLQQAPDTVVCEAWAAAVGRELTQRAF